MKYMLLIYSNENAWTDDERDRCFAESTQLTHDLSQRGQYLGASPLQPISTATSIRVREGKRLVTDGPFAETREQLGGYFLIEANDLDEAIEIAGRIPGAVRGRSRSGPSSNWRAAHSRRRNIPLFPADRFPHLGGQFTMKVMVLVKASPDSEAGVMPSEKLLTEMGRFNDELVRAGVMLAAEGLHPSSKGVRVRFSGEERTVTDGPFAETKELLAGFWLWRVTSMDEAIAWVKRCPNPMPGDSELEIRPFSRPKTSPPRSNGRAPSRGAATPSRSRKLRENVSIRRNLIP